jgi:hypothetical protein
MIDRSCLSFALRSDVVLMGSLARFSGRKNAGKAHRCSLRNRAVGRCKAALDSLGIISLQRTGQQREPLG